MIACRHQRFTPRGRPSENRGLANCYRYSRLVMPIRHAVRRLILLHVSSPGPSAARGGSAACWPLRMQASQGATAAGGNKHRLLTLKLLLDETTWNPLASAPAGVEAFFSRPRNA